MHFVTNTSKTSVIPLKSFYSILRVLNSKKYFLFNVFKEDSFVTILRVISDFNFQFVPVKAANICFFSLAVVFCSALT